jgi:hypothetical protein
VSIVALLAFRAEVYKILKYVPVSSAVLPLHSRWFLSATDSSGVDAADVRERELSFYGPNFQSLMRFGFVIFLHRLSNKYWLFGQLGVLLFPLPKKKFAQFELRCQVHYRKFVHIGIIALPKWPSLNGEISFCRHGHIEFRKELLVSNLTVKAIIAMLLC